MLIDHLNIKERLQNDKIVPKYTRYGYKKMKIPSYLYDIIIDARNQSYNDRYEGTPHAVNLARSYI